MESKPKKERRKSESGSRGSRPRDLEVPSPDPGQSPMGMKKMEHRQSLPGAIGRSTRNLGFPSSEPHQLVTGTMGSGPRDLTVPSPEHRTSVTGTMGSSTKELVVASPKHRRSITVSPGTSVKDPVVPSSEQYTSVVGFTGSPVRALDFVSAEHRKSVTGATGSRTTEVIGGKAESHKLVVGSRRISTKETEGTKVQRRKWELTRPLLMLTMITCFGSSLQYGYNFWVVNHPAALIEDFYNTTHHLKKKVSINKDFLTFLNSLTIAIFSFGGLIGSLLFSPMVDKFGRKGTLLLNNCLSVVAALLMGLSAIIQAYEYTIFSRLVTGICSGVFSCVVPIYLGEIAPKSLRGGIMTVAMFFVGAGVLISQVLGLPEVLGTKKDWPILLGIPGGLALFQVFMLPFFPESPRYLLIQKRKEEDARQALQKLRCQEDVEAEIEELYEEDQAEKAEKVMNGMKLLCYRGLRWQVISVIVLMGGQQLSGINAAYYYAERIYATMSLSLYEVRYITVFSTLILLFTLIVVAYIVDTVGRRVLILIGFGICSILCVLLTMTLELQNTISWMSYVTSSFIFVYLIGHIVGPGPLPNVIIAELFLQSSRSTGFALGGFVHWLLNFMTGVMFLQIETRIGSYSFLLFWPLCFSTFFYTFKIIPETKGKTFLDIRRLMSVHVAVARKIQVHSRGSSTKQNKHGKRKSTHHSGKKKKRRKSAVGSI